MSWSFLSCSARRKCANTQYKHQRQTRPLRKTALKATAALECKAGFRTETHKQRFVFVRNNKLEHVHVVRCGPAYSVRTVHDDNMQHESVRARVRTHNEQYHAGSQKLPQRTTTAVARRVLLIGCAHDPSPVPCNRSHIRIITESISCCPNVNSEPPSSLPKTTHRTLLA